jgi:hypothetical protein
MGGNQWRVKGEANLEEGATDETRIWTGRNSDRYLKDGVGQREVDSANIERGGRRGVGQRVAGSAGSGGGLWTGAPRLFAGQKAVMNHRTSKVDRGS